MNNKLIYSNIRLRLINGGIFLKFIDNSMDFSTSKNIYCSVNELKKIFYEIIFIKDLLFSFKVLYICVHD